MKALRYVINGKSGEISAMTDVLGIKWF
jgi:hypothetical protein